MDAAFSRSEGVWFFCFVLFFFHAEVSEAVQG